MRYYVTSTRVHEDKTYDRIVYGDTIKRGKRAYTLITNDVVVGDVMIDQVTVEEVFNHPFKSLRSANIFCGKLNKEQYKKNTDWYSKVREYPDEITYDQFSAFVRW